MSEKQKIFIWGDRHSISLLSEDNSTPGGYEWHVVEKPYNIPTETPGNSVAAIIVDGETTHADPQAIKTAFLKKGQAAPPIILITTYRISAMAMALQSGYDDFLAKPVGPAEILAMINKAKQNTNK